MQTLLLSPDAQLLQNFKNGNEKALEILVWRYKDKLFSSILFLVKDKYLAEDIFQDTFIKIIDSIRNNSYNEEGKFIHFAIRVAHNLCVDHFRKIKRAKIVNTGDNDNFFETFNSSENTAADKNIIRFQTGIQVRELIDQLPEDQREVIVLRHFADLSFKEIAEMTDCSINTALGRMRYGLINLRKMLVEKQVA